MICQLISVSLSCKTFYRDHDTLREIETISNDILETIDQDDFVPLEMPIEQRPSKRRRFVSDVRQYEVAGLKNLDIQIVPRITSAEPATASQVTSDEHTKIAVVYALVQGAWQLKEGDNIGYDHAFNYVNKIQVCSLISIPFVKSMSQSTG